MRRAALLAALTLGAAPAAGFEAGDPHLRIISRKPEEAARVAAVTAPATQFDAPEQYEANPGGAGTAPITEPRLAFQNRQPNLPAGGDLDFIAGEGLFQKIWVAAPTATQASDGLGPLYSARSCFSCHVNNGRGHPPVASGGQSVSLVMHLAMPADSEAAMAEIEDWIATKGDPIYGHQIQDFGVVGQVAEAALHVDWVEEPMTLADGAVVSLRKPIYRLDELAHGPLAPDTMRSPRAAPPMIGLGLLEAIPAADILAREDPDDADGDGISGRANFIWSETFSQPMLGRFGLKAGQSTLRAQTATAFANDIGISTPVRPEGWGDCTEAQPACHAAPHGDGDARVFEANAQALDLTTFYAATLAVPARRNVDDPKVLAGKQLFYETGCIACHTPKHVTHRLEGRPEHSFQLIWPYTDLLLHDMGPGLADGFTEGRATGTEWRTPPLWGLGLTGEVSGETTYLHDGRARSLLEAILWHGGEAEPARDAVAQMPEPDRAALIRFLESL